MKVLVFPCRFLTPTTKNHQNYWRTAGRHRFGSFHVAKRHRFTVAQGHKTTGRYRSSIAWTLYVRFFHVESGGMDRGHTLWKPPIPNVLRHRSTKPPWSRGIAWYRALTVSMSQTDIDLQSPKDKKPPGDITVLSPQPSMSAFSMWNQVEWIGNTRCENHRFHMFWDTVRPCSTVTVKRCRFPTSKPPNRAHWDQAARQIYA